MRHMKSLKSQASVEFMVVSGLVILVFIVLGIVVQQKIQEAAAFKIDVHGRRVVYKVASNINEIESVGDGYAQCFTLPGRLYGDRKFMLRFYTDEPLVYVLTQDLSWTAPLYTVDIQCLISPPCSTYTSSRDPIDIWAVNRGGTVYLEDHGPCGFDWINITNYLI